MIFGIGTDIIQIVRIEKALARHGERFAARILGHEEMDKFRQRSARVLHPTQLRCWWHDDQ